MIELLNDLKEIINKLKSSNNEEERLVLFNDYKMIKEVLELYSDFEIPEINSDEYDDLLDKANKSKERITKEIYNNLDYLEELYNKLLETFENIDIENLYENYDDSNMNIFLDFFRNYGNMQELYTKMVSHNQIIVNEEFGIASSMHIKSLDKHYIFLPETDNIISIPHEMGHIYQNSLIDAGTISDNFIVEFTSVLMEYTFLDYYEKYNKDKAHEVKKKILTSNLFMIFSALSQIQLMQRHPDAFINMELNPKYQDELNSMNLFGVDFRTNELYLQYYAISLLLIMKYYYKIKETNNFDVVRDFIIKNKDTNLYELLSNNIDLSLIPNFVNDFIGNNKKASK